MSHWSYFSSLSHSIQTLLNVYNVSGTILKRVDSSFFQEQCLPISYRVKSKYFILVIFRLLHRLSPAYTTSFMGKFSSSPIFQVGQTSLPAHLPARIMSSCLYNTLPIKYSFFPLLSNTGCLPFFLVPMGNPWGDGSVSVLLFQQILPRAECEDDFISTTIKFTNVFSMGSPPNSLIWKYLVNTKFL